VIGRADATRRPYAFDSEGSADSTYRRSAAFLDRDGVLNEAVPDPVSGMPESPLGPDEVRLLPGAAAAARDLAHAGYLLVCVSNQPAAAKGQATVEQLLAVHERVLELLEREGVRLDAWRLCLHHPEGVGSGLSGACDCRKPAPGMLLDAARTLGIELGSSWMVGDTDADIAAGEAAGCRTVLIEYAGSAHKRFKEPNADMRATDLADAVTQLLDQRPQ
jgi:D-glycero-D-manno-heptose 1,7-bisphosphate phosphatase